MATAGGPAASTERQVDFNMKNCSRKACAQINPQPETSFGACKRTKSGFRPECNSCRKTEAAKQYRKSPEKFLARNARWASKHPDRARRARIEAELNAKPYRRAKKSKCDECNFVPVVMCQLDVDHINGDHNDNSIENLQTLCANCHRLKTKQSRDGQYSIKRFKTNQLTMNR